MAGFAHQKLNLRQSIAVSIWVAVFLGVGIPFSSSFGKLLGIVLSLLWVVGLVLIVLFFKSPVQETISSPGAIDA